MFERYTEQARRTIFFARYEASNYGSRYIETEHLLLGLLRENKRLNLILFGEHSRIDEIRKRVDAHTPARERIATSVDIPLSDEGKLTLAYAAEEAERLELKHIGTEHLLLGILRESKSFGAAILNQLGITLENVRKELASIPAEGETRGGVEPAQPSLVSIEFRARGKMVGTTPSWRNVPRIGECIVTPWPLTPGKMDLYRVSDVTYEYAHAGDVPPPLPLRLARIVVELVPAESSKRDVE